MEPSGWPRPNAIGTLVALLVIFLVGAGVATLTEIERSKARTHDDGVTVGEINPEAAMVGRILGAVLESSEMRDAVLGGGVNDVTAEWGNGPLAMRLARAIMYEIDGDPEAALAAFDECAVAADEHGLTEQAAPMLRVVASLLRESAQRRLAAATDAAAIEFEQQTIESLERWSPPSAEDVADAQERLGSMLTLGQALAGHDPDAARKVEREGWTALAVLGAFVVWAAAAFIGGVVTLIILIVLATNGRLRSGTGPGRPETAVLLEVFALHMVLLVAVGAGSELMGDKLGGGADHGRIDATTLMLLFAILGQVFTVAIPLFWWRFRKGAWSTLRESAGLHFRGGVVRLTGIGLLGYMIGVVLAVGGFIVSWIIGALLGIEKFGSPSHPVQEALSEGGALGAFVVFLLGAVIAPITEEIFFRGAFYRGLRDRLGPTGSALVAGSIGAMLVSTLYFGAIHPQGLLFAPVLAGLGVGFCLVREWTGSAYPGMVAHALNNAIMLALAFTLLG